MYDWRRRRCAADDFLVHIDNIAVFELKLCSMSALESVRVLWDTDMCSDVARTNLHPRMSDLSGPARRRGEIGTDVAHARCCSRSELVVCQTLLRQDAEMSCWNFHAERR